MKINISIEEDSGRVDELIEKILETINELGGAGGKDDWTRGWDQAIEACYIEVGEVIDNWRKAND